MICGFSKLAVASEAHSHAAAGTRYHDRLVISELGSAGAVQGTWGVNSKHPPR